MVAPVIPRLYPPTRWEGREIGHATVPLRWHSCCPYIRTKELLFYLIPRAVATDFFCFFPPQKATLKNITDCRCHALENIRTSAGISKPRETTGIELQPDEGMERLRQDWCFSKHDRGAMVCRGSAYKSLFTGLTQSMCTIQCMCHSHGACRMSHDTRVPMKAAHTPCEERREASFPTLGHLRRRQDSRKLQTH